MEEHYLQGGCSCGRNQYEVVLPSSPSSHAAARVLFGHSSEIRRAHASSLPIFLRVPLPWLQSTTYAFTRDERPSDIKRAFSPNSAPQTRRNFCGFCGTPLTFWSEEDPEEAGFICISLASLERNSLGLLDTIGLLPTTADEDEIAAEVDQGQGQSGETPGQVVGPEYRLIHGEPWFEELIESAPLGKLKKKRGMRVGSNGRTVVEWEVIELIGDDGTETPTKKQMLTPHSDESMKE